MITNVKDRLRLKIGYIGIGPRLIDTFAVPGSAVVPGILTSGIFRLSGADLVLAASHFRFRRGRDKYVHLD